MQADKFCIIPGGGEANVAISCANFGHDAYFVSKLPKHEIGQIAVNALRRYGVNTDYIARGGNRVGLYYAETGASMRPSKVIYDRAYSSIAEAKPSPKISISTAYSKVQTGFTGVASHLPSAMQVQNVCVRHVSQPSVTELP